MLGGILLILIVHTELFKCDTALQRTRRAAVPFNAIRWPNNVIPFIIDKVYFKTHELRDLEAAMKTWNDETCVRFRAYRRGDKQWIRITDGDSCFSQYVGYSGRGGEQRLTLSKNGCRFYGLCLHELGHVIGLDHEHVRSDRDEHLQVNLAGVPRDLWAFFSRRTKDQLKTYDSPYDLQSVMHYGASSLSLFADKTPIDVKDPNMRHVLRDVYIKETSFWDARAVNLHYQCQEECQSARPSCDFPGYVDKFCKCQQPAEFSRRRCVDVHGTPECRNLAEKLECYRNASFMSINCRKTCGFCYKDKLSEIEKPPKQDCKDRHENCAAWSKEGQCTKASSYMKLMCPESCGLCQGTDNSAEEGGSECVDHYVYPSDCEAWAKQGLCEANKLWMYYNCAKSCGRCSNSKGTAPLDGAIKQAGQSPASDCKDTYGETNCRRLAARQLCTSHPSWMRQNCPATCGFCQSNDLPATNAPNSRPQNEPVSDTCQVGDPANGCPRYSSQCRSLAIYRRCPNVCKNCGPCADAMRNCETLKKYGYCATYPASTIPQCRKTCGACV